MILRYSYLPGIRALTQGKILLSISFLAFLFADKIGVSSRFIYVCIPQYNSNSMLVHDIKDFLVCSTVVFKLLHLTYYL